MPFVRFEPVSITIEVPVGTLLIDAARQAGLHVAQQCGGGAICGWCVMQVESGLENLGEPEPAELRLFRRNSFADNERASCHAEVMGDVVVSTKYWG